MARVRRFFKESIQHYDRLLFRDAIAACWGLDMATPGDRDALCKRVAEERNVRRETGVEWVTGESDPPPDELRLCLTQMNHLRTCRSEVGSINDLIQPARLGIARTLAYIRVMPPAKPSASPIDAEHHPAELHAAWKLLRRHPHYRNPGKKPREDLNQHALDAVADAFGGRLCIEPHEIGELRDRIEHPSADLSLIFWIWPFAVFKYATTCKIESRNHTIRNPYAWVWEEPGGESGGEDAIWRRSP